LAYATGVKEWAMNKTSVIIAAYLFVVVFVTATSEAHKNEHGVPIAGHSSAMMQAKKAIPEEYKVMDRTPVTPGIASTKKGEALFKESCSMCHGVKGDGRGEVALDMELSIASFRDKKHSGMYGPGEKYWIIQHGIEALEMPAFPEFSPQERWSLVNYIIYSLQKEGR